jgi:hypothetical protein
VNCFFLIYFKPFRTAKKKTLSSVKHARKESKKDEKYATNQEGKQLLQFRNNYLNICEKLKLLPSNELLRNMKTCIRNQTSLKRLSICHAEIDDDHIKAIVSSLKYYDEIQEILLNHNNITDEVKKNFKIKKLTGCLPID